MKEINTSANKIFFTSDLHFGNQGLLGFNKRPFTSAKDMDNSLINNWNNIVAEDALTFILGDIGEISDQRFIQIFEQLNGAKILIKGNHDYFFSQKLLQEIFIEVHDLIDINVYDAIDSKYQQIVLCHYPMFDWNNFHEGAWQLFGHIHTRELLEFKTLKTKLFAQQYDVGVDGNNFSPVSFYNVKSIIEKQMRDNTFKQTNYY